MSLTGVTNNADDILTHAGQLCVCQWHNNRYLSMKRYKGRGTNNKGITKHLHYSHRLLSRQGPLSQPQRTCVSINALICIARAGDTFCIIFWGNTRISVAAIQFIDSTNIENNLINASPIKLNVNCLDLTDFIVIFMRSRRWWQFPSH